MGAAARLLVLCTQVQQRRYPCTQIMACPTYRIPMQTSGLGRTGTQRQLLHALLPQLVTTAAAP